MARFVVEAGHYAEIYADYKEFEPYNSRDGLLLVAQSASEEVLNELREGRCLMPVLLYAPSPTLDEIRSAFRAGCLDVLDWPSQEGDLAASLDEIIFDCDRRFSITQQIRAARQAVADLSQREMDVLSALVLGGSNKEIAARFGISPRTVEIHRANAYKKVGAKSTADAVRIGIFAGLVPEVSVNAVMPRLRISKKLRGRDNQSRN